MTTAKEYIQSTFETVKARNGHEAEFLQAVEEFLSTLEPEIAKALSTKLGKGTHLTVFKTFGTAQIK